MVFEIFFINYYYFVYRNKHLFIYLLNKLSINGNSFSALKSENSCNKYASD
jgi:hypothetical protein